MKRKSLRIVSQLRNFHQTSSTIEQKRSSLFFESCSSTFHASLFLPKRKQNNGVFISIKRE